MTPVIKAISVYVIYANPLDYPDNFVVREWVGIKPSIATNLYDSLEAARKYCQDMGLYKLERHTHDDPSIVETWL